MLRVLRLLCTSVAAHVSNKDGHRPPVCIARKCHAPSQRKLKASPAEKLIFASPLLSDTHRPRRDRSMKDGKHHTCMGKKATIHQTGLACLQHPTPSMSVWVVMGDKVLADIEETNVEAGYSCFVPKLGCCRVSSQLSIHPSIKQARHPSCLHETMRRDMGRIEGPGTFNLGSLPNRSAVWNSIEASVSGCFITAKCRSIRGYHGMHVAVPCGSVPEAKAEQRANERSPSHRKHHHWPKRTAQCPDVCREPGRGSWAARRRSPANHWADMGMRPNGLS